MSTFTSNVRTTMRLTGRESMEFRELHFFLIILLSALQANSGQCSDMTEGRTAEAHAVTVGSNVTFSCEVNKSNIVNWLFVPPNEITPRVVYNGRTSNPHFRRHRIQFRDRFIDLTIDAVQLSDAGQYVCRQVDGVPMEHRFELFVFDQKPTWRVTVSTEEQESRDSVEDIEIAYSLTCAGNMQPIMSCYRSNVTLVTALHEHNVSRQQVIISATDEVSNVTGDIIFACHASVVSSNHTLFRHTKTVFVKQNTDRTGFGISFSNPMSVEGQDLDVIVRSPIFMALAMFAILMSTLAVLLLVIVFLRRPEKVDHFGMSVAADYPRYAPRNDSSASSSAESSEAGSIRYLDVLASSSLTSIFDNKCTHENQQNEAVCPTYADLLPSSKPLNIVIASSTTKRTFPLYASIQHIQRR